MTATAVDPGSRPIGAAWLGAILLVAVLAAGLAVDASAQAAFTAPKQLLLMLAAVAGLLALLWSTPPVATTPVSAAARWLAWGGTGLLGWWVLATVLAPQPALAIEPLRTMVLYGSFVLLGAATLWTPVWRRRLLWTALAVCALNAVLSLLQALDINLVPIPVARLGGRFPTIALLGNEAYVSLAAALAGCAALALATQPGLPRPRRWLALGLLGLCLATIVLNRQLTSLAALGAGALALLCVRWRWHWAVRVGALGVLLVATSALLPAMQRITWGQWGTLEQWQQRSTWRLSGWATATEMLAQRPLFGQGPGSFERESQRFRLAGELRWRERLLPPPTANTFTEAHNEFLQVGAEAGLPALLLALIVAGGLLDRLLHRAIARPEAEERLLLGVLVAGAVASLAWFPLQIPLTAVLLLLAAGRAWRLLSGRVPA